MPQREFEITIAANGEVEIHIRGYKGKTACMNVAALFEKTIGEIKTVRETSEAYEPDEPVRTRQQH